MSLSSPALLLSTLLLGGGGDKVELVEPVTRIWNEGRHNAFTDLIRFQDSWICVFREGAGHASGAGTIRVLASSDGKDWNSSALLAQTNVDLRDPHISRTDDGRLMIVAGAAVPPTRDPLTDHYSVVSFSKDAKEWSEPRRVVPEWHWLWRVTWHKGSAFGVAYSWTADKNKKKQYRGTLFSSKDGLDFKPVAAFDLPQTTEATVRFDGDTMLCLQRRDGSPNSAHLGISEAPYKKWKWIDLGKYFGGPNFIQAKDGTWWACGRIIEKGKAQTVLCRLDVKKGTLTPALTLPSGGDNSYAGLAWHGDQLWISYYSSHEGKSSIYLAKVRISK